MKNIALLMILLLTNLAFAQQKLEVSYNSYIDMKDESEFNIVVDGGNKEEIRKSILENMKVPKPYTLTIFGNDSYYKMIEKVDNEQKTGIILKVSFGGTGTYYNMTDNYYLEQANLANKEITIKDQSKTDWKLTRETKKILGYNVKKATRINDNGKEIVAWYTTDLNYKTGPEKYVGLPGLILEVEEPYGKSPDNKRYISVTDVKILEDTKPLPKPSEKKTISLKEFEKKSKEEFEKMKEMMSQGVEKND